MGAALGGMVAQARRQVGSAAERSTGSRHGLASDDGVPAKWLNIPKRRNSGWLRHKRFWLARDSLQRR